MLTPEYLKNSTLKWFYDAGTIGDTSIPRNYVDFYIIIASVAILLVLMAWCYGYYLYRNELDNFS